MRLETEGHIQRSKRMIVIADWQKMAEVADFDPRYRHVGARQNEVGGG